MPGLDMFVLLVAAAGAWVAGGATRATRAEEKSSSTTREPEPEPTVDNVTRVVPVGGAVVVGGRDLHLFGSSPSAMLTMGTLAWQVRLRAALGRSMVFGPLPPSLRAGRYGFAVATSGGLRPYGEVEVIDVAREKLVTVEAPASSAGVVAPRVVIGRALR